jgi:hypothetical protein
LYIRIICERIFEVKKEFLSFKCKISPDVIALMDKWRHTGFNDYCGPRILPWHKKSMENLTHYIIHASFSQKRMTYLRKFGQVEYK